MRKKIALILVLAIFLIMTGCGGENTVNPEPNKPGQTTQIPFPDAPAAYDANDALSEQYDMKSVMIEGEPYQGKETRFFAYIGLPDEASKENRVPGIVLLHGSGGTAFPEWVREWNARGYAAIAVDYEGYLPPRTTTPREHEYSGPHKDGTFADITYAKEQDTFWYHAVSIASRAYETLGNYEEVDENAIGLMGISWGGIIGSIVLGREPRFAFGIMVYGCGFLYEAQNFYQDAIDAFPEQIRQYYIDNIDAASTFSQANMPILWLNSDEDQFFSPMIMTKSYLATSYSFMSLKPSFAHSHRDGWEASEPYEFADSMVKSGIPLMQIVPLNVKGTEFVVNRNGRTLRKLSLYYSTADALTTWQAEVNHSLGNTYTDDLFQEQAIELTSTDSYAIQLPDGTKTYYLYAEDDEGNSVSTQLYY